MNYATMVENKDARNYYGPNLNTIDFSLLTKKNEKVVNDWYKRASSESNEWYAEYCYNMALYHNHTRAVAATEEFFHKDKMNRVVRGDETIQSTLNDEIVLFDEREVEVERKEDTRKWGAYLERQKWLKHLADPRLKVTSQYIEQSVDSRVLCDKLYSEILNFAQQSSLHKLFMGWYLYDNSFAEILSEEQLEYWETTFEELDILYESTEGNVRPSDLIACSEEIDEQVFEKIQLELMVSINKFYQAPPRRAKKVIVEEEIDD